MNEDLHKEDDGSHDGEEQLIQVCLQLTAVRFKSSYPLHQLQNTMKLQNIKQFIRYENINFQFAKGWLYEL